MPDANQAFRELTMQIVADRAEGEVRPRVFFEDFPNMVLYVREVPQSGGWQDVLAADTKNPAQPVIYLARSGRMLVDRQARTIQMVLQDGARHTTKLARSRAPTRCSSSSRWSSRWIRRASSPAPARPAATAS